MKTLVATLLSIATVSAFAATAPTTSTQFPSPESLMAQSNAKPSGTKKVETLVVHRDNRSISIRFPANATTGYRWFLTNYNHDLLTLSDAYYIAPKTSRVGAGGQARAGPGRRLPPPEGEGEAGAGRGWGGGG